MSSPRKSPAPARSRAAISRRLIGILALALVVCAAMHYYLVGPGTLGLPVGGATLPSAGESGRYQSLSGLERQRSDDQRQLARELARRHVGSDLSGSEWSDLRVIQAIVDAGVLDPQETYELQALGVALGDVMAAQLGLRWIAYQDELGRNRALRLPDTDVVIFPVTMISKRVEAGVDVSLEDLRREAIAAVNARG